MAKITIPDDEKVIKINRWLGVNQSAEGDVGLALGELSDMTNFKITNDGCLQKRPGTALMANLLSAYEIVEATEPMGVISEIGSSTYSVTAYPTIGIGAAGEIELSGTPVTVTAANIGSYVGYYVQIPMSGIPNLGGANGVIGLDNTRCYRLGSIEYAGPTGTLITGGYVNISETLQYCGMISNSSDKPHEITVYSGVQVTSGAVAVAGTSTTINFFNKDAAVGKYCVSGAVVYKVNSVVSSFVGYENIVNFYGYAYTLCNDDIWDWLMYSVGVAATTPDTPVRGIWTGLVGGETVIVAACNGKLWKLFLSGVAPMEGDPFWLLSKTEIGTLSTTNKVHFFGYDDKLYIMNGASYKCWDGTTYADVIGYRPLVITAALYSGSGTELERVNMLTGRRRVRYSPDGTNKTFTLPETSGVASIDYVKTLATDTEYDIVTTPAASDECSVNASAGTVTFHTAPAAGTNTIEIGYTMTATLRAQIVAMTLSEFFNGANDNRVFLYGDGSSKAYYSGLDYDGNATAEYFPDLNVLDCGESSTPIKSMTRHYNTLLAFKEDSAYSITSGTLTLETGLVTVGFFVSTINKVVGSAGYGQALVVENHPRTLDGRSLYEWTSVVINGSVTQDQRNAVRISQKIERTLREMDLAAAMTYHDKRNHEYYIVQNGIAIVQNTETLAWYIYRDFPATCMTVINDVLYFGTTGGGIRRLSREYLSDCGDPITCFAATGSMDFGARHMRKYSNMLWVDVKPETHTDLYVTVQTDRLSDYEDLDIIETVSKHVATGLFSFLDLDFAHFTFNINDKPKTRRCKVKVKKFVWYKLLFSSVSTDTTATILSASVKFRPTGNAR